MDRSQTFEQFLSVQVRDIFNWFCESLVTASLAQILSVVYVRYGNAISNNMPFLEISLY